jgi:hypothetical protein
VAGCAGQWSSILPVTSKHPPPCRRKEGLPCPWRFIVRNMLPGSVDRTRTAQQADIQSTDQTIVEDRAMWTKPSWGQLSRVRIQSHLQVLISPRFPPQCRHDHSARFLLDLLHPSPPRHTLPPSPMTPILPPTGRSSDLTPPGPDSTSSPGRQTPKNSSNRTAKFGHGIWYEKAENGMF